MFTDQICKNNTSKRQDMNQLSSGMIKAAGGWECNDCTGCSAAHGGRTECQRIGEGNTTIQEGK